MHASGTVLFNAWAIFCLNIESCVPTRVTVCAAVRRDRVLRLSGYPFAALRSRPRRFRCALRLASEA